MRPIKFRAWSHFDKCWCWAFGIHMSGLFSEMINAKIENWIAIADAHWQDLSKPEENPHGIVLMQFTWLLDKNWQEIFEGDVLQWCDDLLQVAPYWTWFWLRWEMFRRWGFCTCDIAWQYMIKSEVIWNIYEHPNLLTK